MHELVPCTKSAIYCTPERNLKSQTPDCTSVMSVLQQKRRSRESAQLLTMLCTLVLICIITASHPILLITVKLFDWGFLTLCHRFGSVLFIKHVQAIPHSFGAHYMGGMCIGIHSSLVITKTTYMYSIGGCLFPGRQRGERVESWFDYKSRS